MEEFQKRNTDCVYFLASPLTCKKGFDCEYRHSDIARLNPRDCWYWIAGNCLNPDCAFRHPPLDGPSEKSSESTAVPVHQFATPTKKRDAPCYFFFNAFCSKGEQCSFSHASDKTKASLKPLNPISAAPNPPRLDVKPPIKPPSSGSESKTIPVNNETIEPNPKTPKSKKVSDSLPIQIPPTEKEPSDSASLESDDDDQVAQNLYEFCSDDDNDKVGGRWESSPGFDVLVDSRLDSRLDGLSYEDKEDYPFVVDRYEFDDDPKCSEPKDLYNGYDCVGNDHDGDEYEAIRMDLREHLRSRDYYTIEYEERPRRMPSVRNERKSMAPIRDKPAIVKKAWGRNGFRNRRFEERRIRKRQRVASEVCRKPSMASEVCVSFTGPKSLAMIREERRKGRENGDSFKVRGMASGGFEGPKPLSEILEEKRKVC